MTQPAKAQEPSMEEILASIRRIIADDDAVKPPAKPTAKAPEPAPLKAQPAPPPKPPSPPPPPPPAAEAMGQDDIDAMLADIDAEASDEEVEPASEVLELTEEMAAADPAPKAHSFRKIDAQQDVIFNEPPPPPPPAARAAVAPPRAEPIDQPLLSAAAQAAVHTAFGTLAHSMLVQGNKTLEDLVKEMLRPMLKNWLDDNLPTLVERLVRTEIDRVSRGHHG